MHVSILKLKFAPFFSALRFRHWEKNRRDRFNVLLTNLGKTLPGFIEDEVVAQDGDKSKAKIKWSKAEIVEKATEYITALKKLKVPTELKKRIGYAQSDIN